jgi:hypothetical protein
MRAAYRIFSVFMLPAFGVLLPSCLENANPDQLSCTQNQYCPKGYVCVGVQPGGSGKCQKSKDAGGTDSPAPSLDAVDPDGPGDQDGADLGDLALPRDDTASLGDAAEVVDQAVPVDVPIGLDGASEAPVEADLGYEAPPDTPI